MSFFKKDSKSKGPRKSGGGFGRSRGGDDSFSPRGRFPGRSEVAYSDKPRTRSFGGRKASSAMYPAVCSQCGCNCNVPFKPTNKKPVYCDNCFVKEDRGDSPRANFAPKAESGNADIKRSLDQLNKKLDKILEILETE